ncbi:MAG TPA: homoserine dehydrogenase [Acidobacteriota bacterium]|jgi:homoserine dehydrogenase|nr:homoserine dehydrogenase [Acidobacteriota bacterium]
MKEKPSKVAIAGFGTVGRSVAKILCQDRPAQLRLTHICNRGVERKKVPWVSEDVRWTEDIGDVLHSDVDILVELIGGLNPAEDWIRRALAAGKSVVTANKQLIACCGLELMQLAHENGRQLRFEASVAGGIPVISGLREGLAGDRLLRVSGILNGTCNYILTRMESAELPFSVALNEAQDLGFAEADPTDDIEGFDARSKLAILASVGLRCQIRPTDITCRSIKVIEAIDFVYARRLGSTVRQLSRAEKSRSGGRTVFASVQPALVPIASPLARVQGSQNLVMATGEFGGETVFSGHGAGGDPTAVAVVSDLISLAENRQSQLNHFPTAEAPHQVIGEFNSPHYVRFTVADRPGIIAAIASILANYQINIDAVLQERGSDKSKLPFVVTLEECNTSVLESALRDIEKLDFHVQPLVSLPMLG